MYDPGLNRHEWESEWAALEDDLRADPAHALPELDRLVTRMLEESGYELTDPVVVEGDEREIVSEYLAAHEIVQGSSGTPTPSHRATSRPPSTATARSSTTS